MYKWLKSLVVTPPTPEEIRDQQMSDPDMFTDNQREYLRSLFPKGYMHLDNFSQEELLKLAVSLVLFGYNIYDEPDFVQAYDMLVLQGIIVTNPHNGYLVRRA